MTSETRAAEVLAEHVEAWQSDGDYGEKVWLECAVTSCEWNDREALDDIDAERASFYAHVAAALSAADCLRDDAHDLTEHSLDWHAVDQIRVVGDIPGPLAVKVWDSLQPLIGHLLREARDDREGETVTEWSVEAKSGRTSHASEDVARRALSEDGWTLNGSPIVAAHTRTRSGDVVTNWSPITPMCGHDFPDGTVCTRTDHSGVVGLAEHHAEARRRYCKLCDFYTDHVSTAHDGLAARGLLLDRPTR